MELLLLVGAVVGGGVVALTALVRRRALAARVEFRDHELVTATGVVRGRGETLVAPLTGRACIAYESRGRLFQTRASIELLAAPAELASLPFVVATRGGDVLVAGTSLAFAVPPERLVERSEAHELAFLARHGVGRDRHDEVQFDEVIITAGSRVSIRGVVVVERDGRAAGERGYRDDAPTTIRLAPHGDTPVTILRAW